MEDQEHEYDSARNRDCGLQTPILTFDKGLLGVAGGGDTPARTLHDRGYDDPEPLVNAPSS